MQVLMDKSTSPDVGDSVNSVGSFTTVLFDINAAQALTAIPRHGQNMNMPSPVFQGK
jgi:hypothetical protein